MFYQNFADWSSWGKGCFGPGLELQNIYTNAIRKLTQENLDVGSSNIASTVKYFQNINKNRKIEDIMQNNVDYISEVSSKFLEYTQNILKINKDMVHDINNWSKENISENFKELKKEGYHNKKSS